MKYTVFILFNLFVSCKTISSDDIQIYTELLDEYIKQDSIELNGYISERLGTYTYYNIELINGLEAPPPKPEHFTSFFNESDFIKRLNEHNKLVEEYFNGIYDVNCLKSQVISSSDSHSIKTWAIKNQIINKNDVLVFYTFYIPLFNCDSTEVYLQYDYLNGSFGYGNGAIFKKRKDHWILVKWVRNWII